jgi:hypothetical protein
MLWKGVEGACLSRRCTCVHGESWTGGGGGDFREAIALMLIPMLGVFSWGKLVDGFSLYKMAVVLSVCIAL